MTDANAVQLIRSINNIGETLKQIQEELARLTNVQSSKK
jgi:hypothetical protein